MAIDDNTSYELTGYQVKDLAQKIRGKADDDVFVGAGTSVAGSRGLVPAPVAGDNTKFLKGDGTWQSLADNYSSTEQNTGSTWIDDKPIYRKVITVSNPSFSVADHTQAHGISGFSHLVSLTTLFNLGWSTTTWAAADFLAQRGCSMRVDTTYVHWENTNSSIANFTGTLVFIIEYTKSS